jgi:peptide methionine sulfoxide reductase MsrA
MIIAARPFGKAVLPHYTNGVKIVAPGPFYRAEEYHQQYFVKRGLAPSCRRG